MVARRADAAARYADAGHDYGQVAEYVRDLVPRLRVMFVVDTLEYLHKGGRIGGAKRLVGSVLSIKPVLHIENGQIEPLASVRTKSKAIAHMIEVVLGEMQGKQDIHAGIIHAGAPNDAAYIKQQILAAVQPQELLVNELTPVLGANVGPGVVGMGYYTE